MRGMQGRYYSQVTIVALIAALFSGCATQRIAPPLFTSAPPQPALTQPLLLEVPNPPAPTAFEIAISIPHQRSEVGNGNTVMRRDCLVNPGASVVISVPSTVSQSAKKAPASKDGSDDFGFQTDGFFNILEQYLERGLLAAGLNAKDRAKFEAKLRDLRDSGDVVRRNDSAYGVALASLQKDLTDGKLTREQFTEQERQLRDSMLDATQTSKNREELTDISEVIRAAQDGDVMADYILQVNELAVVRYDGAPLQLGTLPEVREALRQHPGLRIGTSDEGGGVIPSTLKQPWAQARCNAKLIDVKTGSIDWIGEHVIESLAVLENGVKIVIGVRKRPTNAVAAVRAIDNHNSQVQLAYRKALEAKQALDARYLASMQNQTYFGVPKDGEVLQERRKQDVERAEEIYTKVLGDYNAVMQRRPAELGMDWQFEYAVDAPVVVPDLISPQSEEDKQRFMQHIKDLGAKVTHELLATIKTGK